MNIVVVGSAVVVGASLALISALHVYWLAGGSFPAGSREELGPTVVGTRVGVSMPSRPMTILVSCAFLGAGIVPLALARLVPLPVPDGWVHAAGIGLASVFALRGVYGFFDSTVRPATVGTPFERLNRRVYSPLCLALAGLTAVTLVLGV